MKPQIILKDVIKVYKQGFIDVTALRGVSLTLNKGDFISIMGPSGSGKSTLLNVLGGIAIPTAGEIVIDNEDISKFSEANLTSYRRRKVGFLWQSANLLPDLNIIDNIKYCMHTARVIPKKEINDRANKLLEEVEMLHRAGHKLNELSGGEITRAGLALALANDPDILLADEPTGEIDSDIGKKIINLLKKLSKKHQKTVIIVTHDAYVGTATDITLLMDDGNIFIADNTEVEIDNEGYLLLSEKYRKMFSKSVRIKLVGKNELKVIAVPE
ncbi:MAG: ABC transporter ATP-binding protein [Candidatus Hodarchaeales archaeon]|jgi:putative ABC transport system ATP-binding protein